MAKITALTTACSLDDAVGAPVDISGDVISVTFSTPYAVADVSGVDKVAAERLVLSADATGSLNGIFNAALSHAVLATTTVTGGARTLTVALPGPATLAGEVIISDYTVSRAEDGSLAWTAAWETTGGAGMGWT